MNCPYSSWTAGILFHGLPWCTNLFIVTLFLAKPTAPVRKFQTILVSLFPQKSSTLRWSCPPKPSQHSCLETRMDLATSLSSALRVESNQIPIALNKNRDGGIARILFFSKNLSLNCEVEPFFPCFFNTWTPQSSSAQVLLLCFTNQNNPESRATIPYPTYHLEILYRVKFLGLAPIESLPRQKHRSGIIFSKGVEDAKCW